MLNTLGFERSGIVELGFGDVSSLIDQEGNVYPVQETENGSIAYIKNIPPKGLRSYSKSTTKHSVENLMIIKDKKIETPYYVVLFDKSGNICSLIDKRCGRELLPKDKVANLFRMFEDKPIYYDNWDIDVFYSEKYWDILELNKFEWIEEGPIRATLYMERTFSNSKLCQHIRFYADDARIDFNTWVDWKESQHLLKVLFPLDINTDEASYDIQFGNVTRKTHKNTSWEQARFESCAHKWMDVSEGNFGVSLLNDCKYGHSVDDNVIGLSLIKSGIEPNPTTDQEEHIFTYSLFPHQGSWQQAQTDQAAYALNQPLYSVDSAWAAEDFCFVKVNNSNVIIVTIKLAEDGKGIIIRVYENHNARTSAEFTLYRNPNKVYECDLLENKLNQIIPNENRVEF
ncbi:MAG: glycoside hydrolase family 38 C-terminal domain-containing protein, partial [Lentimicrobiaceae bacterium]|nr:glycoside hydrolase family 38 C-terminal domain-containing protein [Lentimicrobiaceae bacterium]